MYPRLETLDAKQYPNINTQLKQELKYGSLSGKHSLTKFNVFVFNAKGVLSMKLEPTQSHDRFNVTSFNYSSVIFQK